jgi:hypothetical protein
MAVQSKVNQWKGLKSKPTRSNKYKAVKTAVNGKTCDSKIEAGHYKKLLTLQEGGAISDLILHPRYPIIINGIKVTDVVLDFEFIEGGVKKYVDVKGMYTSDSKRWHKLLQAYLGIEIEIWREAVK